MSTYMLVCHFICLLTVQLCMQMTGKRSLGNKNYEAIDQARPSYQLDCLSVYTNGNLSFHLSPNCTNYLQMTGKRSLRNKNYDAIKQTINKQKKREQSLNWRDRCFRIKENSKYHYFASPILNYSNFFFFLYSINFVFIRGPHQDCNKKKYVYCIYTIYQS